MTSSQAHATQWQDLWWPEKTSIYVQCVHVYALFESYHLLNKTNKQTNTCECECWVRPSHTRSWARTQAYLNGDLVWISWPFLYSRVKSVNRRPWEWEVSTWTFFVQPWDSMGVPEYTKITSCRLPKVAILQERFFPIDVKALAMVQEIFNTSIFLYDIKSTL
jgi:hypothetical protein